MIDPRLIVLVYRELDKWNVKRQAGYDVAEAVSRLPKHSAMYLRPKLEFAPLDLGNERFFAELCSIHGINNLCAMADDAGAAIRRAVDSED